MVSEKDNLSKIMSDIWILTKKYVIDQKHLTDEQWESMISDAATMHSDLPREYGKLFARLLDDIQKYQKDKER